MGGCVSSRAAPEGRSDQDAKPPPSATPTAADLKALVAMQMQTQVASWCVWGAVC
ncbi:MAG: hypothetical protein MHM6MM_008842 [Cercozoa sp. M6MM]